MTSTCVPHPGVVTEEMRLAAQAKTEELFAQLIMAKNEWQYAVQNEEAAYQKVLRVKAEYAEWRALTERLTQILEGKADPQCEPTPEPLGTGTTGFFAKFSPRRFAGRG